LKKGLKNLPLWKRGIQGDFSMFSPFEKGSKKPLPLKKGDTEGFFHNSPRPSWERIKGEGDYIIFILRGESVRVHDRFLRQERGRPN
jgi:hypothetical protein